MFPGMLELVSSYRRLEINPKSFGWRGIRTKTVTYVNDRGTVPGAPVRRRLYHNNLDPWQINPEEIRARFPGGYSV